MEPPESKTELNELKQPTRSKRRISSILKAPRTPLKSIAPDNEDPQEETAEPTERKRKSRRVSFASTDDIHVFVKDFKNGSSLENLLQDLSGAGEETLNNTGGHMVKDGGPPIIDMETLLNGPLHTPQHQDKENIIGYGVHSDLGDKTVVFSEDDTAFMNMTHSHTIIIDGKEGENDGNVFGGGNPDFATAARGAKSSTFENSNGGEAAAFKTCSASRKGLIEETEFEDFLANLTRSSASGRSASSGASASSATLCSEVPSPAPKVDTKKFLARLRAQKLAVDQENHVPLGTSMPAQRDRSSQGSHRLRDRTINSEEQENIDLTTSHTAISDKGMLKCKTFTPSAEQEDMELTRSQTLVIDSKTCHVAKSLNSTAKDLSMLAPNKTLVFSGADRDMELTVPFTGYIEEIPNPSTKKNEKLWLFPPTNTVPLSGQVEKAHAQVDANVASCLWPASSSDPEDMEMTRSQNVVDSKNCLTPSVGKQGNVSCMHAPNKTDVFSEVDHDMEMTDVFTGRLEVNECPFNQNATGVISHVGRRDLTERKSIRMDDIGSNNGLRLGTLSNFEDMEVTRSQSVIDSKNYLTPLLGKSISGSCMQDMKKSTTFAHRGRTDNQELTGSRMDAKDLKSSLLCTPSLKPYDTDLTRNQTVIIQSKKCPINLSVKSQSNLSSSNKTIMFSDMDCDMDMTDAITGIIQENQDPSSKRQENTGRSFSKSNLLSTPSSNPDDMDLTRDQTIVIESKNCPINPLVKSQSYLSSSNKTIIFSDVAHDMEITNAITGIIQENQDPSSKRQENTGCSFSKSNLLCAPSNPDDMDLTRNQTVVIESKNCPISHPVKSQSYLASSNKTIMFSDVDRDMEMTDAITGIIQENQDSSSKRQENTGRSFSKSNLLSTPSSNPDDMDLTRDQTVVIESKNCPINPLVKSQSYLSSSNKTIFSDVAHDMEMTNAITGLIQENQDPSSKRQENTGRSFSKSNLLSTPSSNPDDMDLTRDQTVVIESKNFPINPLVKSQSYLSSSNKTIIFSDVAHDMEMTNAITGLLQENQSPSSIRQENTGCSFSKSNLLYAPSNLDDMDLTRNQTIVIESKNCPISHPVKSQSYLSSNKTIMFSDVDHDMEITDAITGLLEVNQNPSSKRRETISGSFPKSTLLYTPSNPDDMDMTRNQTIVIESKNFPVNPLIKSESYHSTSNKTIMFSDVGHDMEMTDAITGLIQENQGSSSKRRETTSCSSQKSSLLCAASTIADGMDMTRSQVKFIDSKNCPLNPTSSVERRTSFQLPPNKTIVFSDAPHYMDMTNAFTGRILENADICTGGNKTPDRPSSHDKTTECSRAWEVSSSDPNDMELTRSQTVVLDSKRGTAKASLSTARKSLSLILPSSKASMFPAGLCGIQVSKALVGNDIDRNKLPTKGWGMAAMLSMTNDVSSSVEPEVMGKSTELEAAGDPNDMEIRNESLECQDAGRQNRLPHGETRNGHCESVCNKTQISSCEDYGVEMIETLVGQSVKCGLPPTGGDEAEIAVRIHEANSTGVCVLVASPGSCTWGVISSEGVENEEIQRVCVRTRDEDMATSSTSAMSETSFTASSNAQFSSGTHYDIAADQNVPACTDGVGSRVGSSPAPEFVPPPCLPSCETVAEGTTLRPADLTVFGEMSDDAPLVNSVVPLNEGRPDTTDNSEYSLATDSSRIDHSGKQTDKRAKSRRMSLADLQSKLQDIGHMITEKFDPVAYPSTAPIPPLTVPSSLRDEDAACLPMVKPDSDDRSRDVHPCMTPDHLKFDGQANRTEMLTLSKSKPWTSRLSLASFQPKLPRRSKPPSLNQEGSTGKGEATVRLRESEFLVAEGDCDGSEVKNIEEETLPEISSEDDLSGTVEVGIFRDREQEAVPSLPAADVEANEPIQNVAQGLKRPFPEDGHECDLPEERKLRSLAIPSNEPEPSAYGVQSDSNMVDIVGMNPPSFMTKTLDSTNFSNCSLNQRSEGTIEMSAQRSSQYDIDYEELFLQELEDGSITVREFLKLFAIDINIHRPRQSALPENFQMDSAPSAAMVLLEKHINRPKQRVYEEDCEELTAMVEKLKTRMKDQDKSLKSTNEALWEAVKSYSPEQFHSLGAKLKERKTFFRKKSKTLAHELKIGLYSKLVQTTQVAQESLTGKIEGMDELLNHLDECLNDLQAELSSMDSAVVEEDAALSETKLAIEVKQQELETLDTVLADNERRVCELELERNAAKAKARKLQEETLELEKRINVIDGLTEWRVSERTVDRAVFMFLYESMGLEVLFEKAADGAVTDAETEQKISDITFQLELDEEKSQCHARLVHSLLSQYIENENSWTQRYPTSLHIPALLHDVALVVGRCRLLGEEVHRLKKWGSLGLDILELDCVETQVQILFSSIKAFAKFEVTLAVSPAYPFTALQLKSFRNYIGNTRIGQVQEIVTSETLAKNLLTRIVKRIHGVLLS